MKAPCTINRMRNGTWLVRHNPELGTVEISAPSREEALMKMQDELQYRIELCPCSRVSGDTDRQSDPLRYTSRKVRR